MHFLVKAHLPDHVVQTFFVGEAGMPLARYIADRMGLPNTVFLSIPSCPALDIGMASHTDLLCHPLDSGAFLFAKNLLEGERDVAFFEQLEHQFPDIKIVKSSREVSSPYPNDILLNSVKLGNFFFSNMKYADPILLSYYRRQGAQLVHVRQGYTRCAICIVNEGACITADEGIAKVLTNNGFDVLKITPGFIELKGYSYGFIGGCSVKWDKQTLVFFGDLSKHPDHARILTFCKEHGVYARDIKEIPLTDIGGMVGVLEQ